MTAAAPTQVQTQVTVLEIAMRQPNGEAYVQKYLASHNRLNLEIAKTQPDFQQGLFLSVLDNTKALQFSQQYLSEHPGISLVQAQNSPEFQAGLLGAAAPASLRNEVSGVLTSKASIPAINFTFGLVTWGTAVLVLLVLLLPSKSGLKTQEVNSEKETTVRAVLLEK